MEMFLQLSQEKQETAKEMPTTWGMWAWPAEIILIRLGCAAGGQRGQDVLLSEIEGEFKQNFIAAYLHYAARIRFLNVSHKRPQNSSLHYPTPTTTSLSAETSEP